MAGPADHSTLINRIARAALRPVGFTQKGRSRFWYEDLAWRANFVDFQPSSWSKGTYCNVGVTWLWGPTAGVKGYWAFHISERVAADSGQFVSFEQDPGAFEAVVEQLARRALAQAEGFKRRFSTLRSVADYYSPDAIRGWPGYHRAIALALIGDGRSASELFARVAENTEKSDIEWVVSLGRSARHLAAIATDRRAVSSAVETQVSECRETLSLPHLEAPVLPPA